MVRQVRGSSAAVMGLGQGHFPVTRRARLVLPALALVFALGLGLSGFWLGQQTGGQAQRSNFEFESVLAQNETDLVAMRATLDAAYGELAVEKSTRSGLEAVLQQVQAELGRAHDQLAFFEQLLPADPDGGVSIRAFEIERRGSVLRYRVLLTRNASDGTVFDGLLRFAAKGIQDGKTVHLVLEPGKALDFDQFRRSTGLLRLPSGFVPQSVTLDVLRARKVHASRTVALARAD